MYCNWKIIFSILSLLSFLSHSVSHEEISEISVELLKLKAEQSRLRAAIDEHVKKNEQLVEYLENNHVDRNGENPKTRNLKTEVNEKPFDSDNNLINKRSACIDGPQIGFHARLTGQNIHLTSGNIKFDDVVTNVGGGYDKNTGVFTVPVSGYYEFIVTIMGKLNNVYISRLFVNGYGKYCYSYGSSDRQAEGMCSNILNLRSNDSVHVVRYSGNDLFGGGYSSFSGHLLKF